MNRPRIARAHRESSAPALGAALATGSAREEGQPRGVGRVRPPCTDPTYAVRAPLVRWLRALPFAGQRVLDVGCGERPYAPLLEAAAQVVGFDRPGNPRADLHGSIEAIPVADASFDVVLCLQVLEHVPDPAAAVRELRRVVRPGGTVLLSTHGVYPYHPYPSDYWRWTHEGLERLLRANGEWATLSVEAGPGVAATAALLAGTVVHLLCKRARLPRLAAPVVAVLNLAAERLDGRLPLLRAPIPGALIANYHVAAVASGAPLGRDAPPLEAPQRRGRRAEYVGS